MRKRADLLAAHAQAAILYAPGCVSFVLATCDRPSIAAQAGNAVRGLRLIDRAIVKASREMRGAE